MGDFPGEAQVWADNHDAFSHQVSGFLHGIMCAFGVLNRAQYSAPWRKMPRHCAR